MAKKLHQRGIYSIHLNNVIELIEQDPDPYFFGSYNWYYSGGNLEILPLDDNTDVMLHTSGASGNILSRFRIEFGPFVNLLNHKLTMIILRFLGNDNER